MNTGSETTGVRPTTFGSLDDVGAGDHDTPYVFGRCPSARAPFPFTTRQYARLLVLRGRVGDTVGREDLAELNGHVPGHRSRGPRQSAA